MIRLLANNNVLWISVSTVFFLGTVNFASVLVLEHNKKDVAGDGCMINPTANNTSPLIIFKGTSDIIYPEAGLNTTKFATNQSVEFACVGNKLNLNGETIVTATCVNKETFNINGQTVDWKNLSCVGNIVPDVLEIKGLNGDDTMMSCYNNADKDQRKIATIGFKLDSDRNITIIKICFDFTNKITLFSSYNITKAIGNSAKNVEARSFKQDTLIYRFPVSLQTWYKNNQTTINTLLGLESNSTKYVNNITFINRGHLAAKADFMYAAMQVATYRYINVAPQWSTINGGNWNQMENSVRQYAISTKTDLQIWTGTYGISTLPNVSLNSENIYIYFNPNDTIYSPSVPIPTVFWKLVYNHVSQQGIVLVSHNNPYENQTNICDTDISDKVSWLNWDENNLTKGYSYACDYNDNLFQNTVTYVPKIDVQGLLV